MALAPQTEARLLTTSIYPPLRGTLFSVEETDFLYTTGFLAALNEFHGVHVPTPLQITDHIGQDTARDALLREIFVPYEDELEFGKFLEGYCQLR